MSAFREIGQILDLMRFEYDSKNLELDTDFLLIDEGTPIMPPIPQLIPNPEADRERPAIPPCLPAIGA